MRGDVLLDLGADTFDIEDGLVDGRPLHHPVPEAIDEFTAADGATVVGPEGDRSQFAEVHTQRSDVDEFVGSDPFDDLGGELRIVAPIDEHVGRAQDLLGLGEAELGTELDDQQVREQRDAGPRSPAGVRA